MDHLEIGQLVKINNYLSPAYGRYGHVAERMEDTVKIEFADLPLWVKHRSEADGRFMVLHTSAVEAVQGIPVASRYLLITVLTLVGTQEYEHHAIAHVEEGQSMNDVAETVAARFFSSLGEWDGEFYIWANTPHAAKLCDFKQITVAEYVELARTTPDYDMGADVSGTPF